MRKTRAWGAASIALALTALVGCGSSSLAPHVEQQVNLDENGSHLYEAEKTLSDGRTVTCVIYANYKQGGLSCDWDGAR